jgi:hypothetical protein
LIGWKKSSKLKSEEPIKSEKFATQSKNSYKIKIR